MSAGPQTIAVRLATVGLLAVSTPAAGAAIRDSVTVEWAHHGEAPASQPENSWQGSISRSIMLTQRNSFASSNAVVGIDAASKEVSAITKRISHLRTLTDGWIGSGSLAPSPVLLAWLEQHAKLFTATRGTSLIPMEDGSVAIRWSEGALDFTAELRPDMTLYMLIDDADSEDLEEAEAPLTDDALRAFFAAHGSV